MSITEKQYQELEQKCKFMEEQIAWYQTNMSRQSKLINHLVQAVAISFPPHGYQCDNRMIGIDICPKDGQQS